MKGKKGLYAQQYNLDIVCRSAVKFMQMQLHKSNATFRYKSEIVLKISSPIGVIIPCGWAVWHWKRTAIVLGITNCELTNHNNARMLSF